MTRWRQPTIRGPPCCLSWIPFRSVLLLLLISHASSTTSNNNGLTLRVRLANGAMQRVAVAEDSLSVRQALEPFLSDHDDSVSVQSGSKKLTDLSQSLASLGLKHGSLLSLQSTKPKAKTTPASFAVTKQEHENHRWDPFPELAKDYEQARLHAKRRRAVTGSLSFGDLAHLQSALHGVEPQATGPVGRLSMCHVSATRFQSNSWTKSTVQPRVGLLFGTFGRERTNQAKKPKTSLSSTTEAQDYCIAAKVHAVWEPPQKLIPSHYDSQALHDCLTSHPAVLRVATALGLEPVGWIFSHESRAPHGDSSSLPVHAQDVVTGAKLQIQRMKTAGREAGRKWVTLAMDGATGATEAFQLSDTAVQMVAEDMIGEQDKGRHVKTKHAVLVDGQETVQLDTVLCLVNTALLSHKGWFGGTTVNTVKKNGQQLTNKARKALVQALQKDSSSDTTTTVFEVLADMNLLIALDAVLTNEQSERLCFAVRKWARGQKKTSTIDEDIRERLLTVLVD